MSLNSVIVTQRINPPIRKIARSIGTCANFPAMRIIAGKYRSRLLKSLKGEALRPTSDRLRVTLFDVLGSAVEGSHFLDVFAGTGAVGIEALSRGATEAIFIEKHAPAAKLIRCNLDSLGISQGATILASDALPSLQKLATRSSVGPIHLAFLDPPYAAHDDYTRTLAFLGSDAATFLAPDALVIFEHHHKFALPETAGRLARTRVLKQGDAALSFYRWGE
jgi:16S rRNA (guanine966-N2)-methyltransferase